MEIPVEEVPKSRRGVTLGVLFGFLAVGAILLFLVGRTTTPTDTSPEAGFARDMATHHAQAVEMAFITRRASGRRWPGWPVTVMV